MSEYKITLNGTEYYLQVEKIGGDGDEKKRSLMSPGPGLPPPPKAPSPRRTPAPTAKAPASKPPETPRAQVPQSAAPVPEVFSGTNGGREEITAPIPGKILDILVQGGQTVKKGDVLLILEAMKMENQVVASENGVVSRIQVSKGASVNVGDILLVLS